MQVCVCGGFWDPALSHPGERSGGLFACDTVPMQGPQGSCPPQSSVHACLCTHRGGVGLQGWGQGQQPTHQWKEKGAGIPFSPWLPPIPQDHHLRVSQHPQLLSS